MKKNLFLVAALGLQSLALIGSYYKVSIEDEAFEAGLRRSMTASIRAQKRELGSSASPVLTVFDFLRAGNKEAAGASSRSSTQTVSSSPTKLASPSGSPELLSISAGADSEPSGSGVSRPVAVIAGLVSFNSGGVVIKEVPLMRRSPSSPYSNSMPAAQAPLSVATLDQSDYRKLSKSGSESSLGSPSSCHCC